MILSGNGTQQEFFSADTEARLKKLKGLYRWYKNMANDIYAKRVADKFMGEMQKLSRQNSAYSDSLGY